ncbi:MAG: nucleotidyltransferase family protein [Luteolibacter sp.]
MTSDFVMPFSVIILAAGASRRMGSPKALLPWGKRTVLEHLIAVWKEANASEIIVVHDSGNVALGTEMDRLGIRHRITNMNPEDGMMSSIRCAADANIRTPLVAISLVDQPQIPAELIRVLVTAAANESGTIWQPQHKGKHGHPVVFPTAEFLKIRKTSAATLREFLRDRQSSRRFLTWKNDDVLIDLDTPEDYEQAKPKE